MSAPAHAKDADEALTRRAYDLMAAHYDRFWGDRMTPTALRALGELVLPRLALPVERDPRALDLCCGTGQLAAVLSARGWDVTGIDSAEAMLALARRHAPRARFVAADARDLGGEAVGVALGTEPFDVCVSAFDSLNHILEPEGLAAVFRGVHGRLRPGGAFLFDLNARRGFQARFQGGFDLADDDLVCHVEASFDALEGIGRYAVTLREAGLDASPAAGPRGGAQRPARDGAREKARPGGGDGEPRSARAGAPGSALPPTTIVLTQRCHAPTHVRAWLRDAGFVDVATYDGERDLGMAGHVGRVFFTAWRPA